MRSKLVRVMMLVAIGAAAGQVGNAQVKVANWLNASKPLPGIGPACAFPPRLPFREVSIPVVRLLTNLSSRSKRNNIKLDALVTVREPRLRVFPDGKQASFGITGYLSL